MCVKLNVTVNQNENYILKNKHESIEHLKTILIIIQILNLIPKICRNPI